MTEKFIIGRNDCDKCPSSFPKTLQTTFDRPVSFILGFCTALKERRFEIWSWHGMHGSLDINNFLYIFPLSFSLGLLLNKLWLEQQNICNGC